MDGLQPVELAAVVWAGDMASLMKASSSLLSAAAAMTSAYLMTPTMMRDAFNPCLGVLGFRV